MPIFHLHGDHRIFGPGSRPCLPTIYQDYNRVRHLRHPKATCSTCGERCGAPRRGSLLAGRKRRPHLLTSLRQAHQERMTAIWTAQRVETPGENMSADKLS